jgi:hypothetical protein
VVKVLNSAGLRIELPFISTRFTLKVGSGGGEEVCAEALGLQLTIKNIKINIQFLSRENCLTVKPIFKFLFDYFTWLFTILYM